VNLAASRTAGPFAPPVAMQFSLWRPTWTWQNGSGDKRKMAKKQIPCFFIAGEKFASVVDLGNSKLVLLQRAFGALCRKEIAF